MGEIRGGRARMRLVALCAPLIFASCTRNGPSGLNGVPVFADQVQLERGPLRDTARREFTVTRAATYVAIVEETDADVRLMLEAGHVPGMPAASVDVESHLNGEGIEVATLEAAAGDQLVLKLEGPHDFELPRSIPVKLLRYDAALRAQPRVRARLDALRAWGAATRFDMTADDMRATGFRNLDAALAHLESVDGDAHLAAWAWLVRANRTYTFSLGWRPVLVDARRAERAFARLGEKRNAARSRLLQAAALVEIALDKTASDPTPQEAARDGVRIFTELSTESALSARERARSINYIGYYLYNTSPAAAATYFERALAQFRAIGDRDGVIFELNNLGGVAVARGEYREAVKIYDQLMAGADRLALPERRAAILLNAAAIDLYAGNTERSIQRYMTLLQISRAQHMDQNVPRALCGLTEAYIQVGDFAQAVVFGNEGVRLFREQQDPVNLMYCLRSMGSVSRDTGNYAQALAFDREAMENAATEELRSRMLANVARDHLAMGNVDKAIGMLRSALTNEALDRMPPRRHYVELTLAEALLSRKSRSDGDIEDASKLGTGILEDARTGADLEMEWSAHKLLAQVHVARHQYDAAREEYRRAIEIIFRYRATTASPEWQTTLLTRAQEAFRGYVDLLMRNVAARPAGELRAVTADEEDALRVLESARVANFDAVRVSRVDAVTQAHVDDLLARMAEKRTRLAMSLASDGQPTASLREVQLDIARLRAEIDLARARGRLGDQSKGWAGELTQPWRHITRGTTQLSYAAGEHFVYVWVRDRTGIRATRLARSPAEADRALSAMTDDGGLRSPAQTERLLSGLSAWLLPAQAIAADAQRVEVVAEGRIAAVPFAALQLSPSSAHRVAESWDVTMITSLFEDAAPASRNHAATFIGIAAGRHGEGVAGNLRSLGTLGTTGIEARSIYALFGRGQPARDVKLLDDAGGDAAAVKAAWTRGADVMHFATHGLADVGQPIASLLMLPAVDGGGNPAYLTAGQVQEWQGDVDLVYLSACDTALGPVRFADGMPGLQRAFLRAGAHGVIATLWPIEDVYASQFALDFYRRYLQGMPPDQALSETQRAWLAPLPQLSSGEQEHRRMTAWAHAYYRR